MKTKILFFGLIAIVAITGFTLISCGDSGGGDPGHTHTPGAAATCTTPQTCTGCGAVIQAVLGHKDLTVTPATCMATGNTGSGTCTRCSETITGQVIPATGHTMGNWTLQTPALYCVGDTHRTGTEKRTCSVCGDVDTRTTLSCLGTEGLVFTVTGSEATVGNNQSITTTSVCIPAYYNGNPVVSIAFAAFQSTSHKNITIPNSVTSIDSYAFYSCSNLESIIVDTGNQYYSSQDGILYDKAKTTLIRAPEGLTGSVTVPNSVTSIGNMAFNQCQKITSVIISNNVTSIGDNAFFFCVYLVSVTIGNGVTSIGSEPFSPCPYLSSITIHAIVPPILADDLFGVGPIPSEIKVPSGSVAAYKAAEGWSAYADIIVAIP